MEKLYLFIKRIRKKYNLIFAKSMNDKKKFESIFFNKVLYFGNLKFYQSVKLNTEKKNVVCFASIHKHEFGQIKEIIKHINNSKIDEFIIIPRHIQFSNQLKKIFRHNNNLKISILDEFGKNNKVYEKSKVVFMGGSLISQVKNPELSRGCKIISGFMIILLMYSELENLLLAKTSKNVI